MIYAKPWLKCVAKTQEYLTKPIEQWNYYQLAGYLLSKTHYKFEPFNVEEIPQGYESKDQTNPRRHPVITVMGFILKECGKSPQQTKTFLDWCLAKKGSNLTYRSLRALLLTYKLETDKTDTSLVDRSTPIPTSLQKEFSCLPYPVSTYGDLAFMWNTQEYKIIIFSILKQNNIIIDMEKII